MKRTISQPLPALVVVLLAAPLAVFAAQRGDFNADGFVDLAVGMPEWSRDGRTAVGAVRVIYGSATNGLQYLGNQLWHIDSPSVPGTVSAHDRFGSGLAAGDFDGDGYSDLAIGVSGYDVPATNAGAVVILFGSAAGLAPRTGHIYYGSSAEEYMGLYLAAADLNKDGRDELIIGCPFSALALQPQAGSVRVFKGAPTGQLQQMQVLGQGNTDAEVPEAYDWFGAALAVGDFDGDGNVDLVVSAPGEDHYSTLVNAPVGDAGVVHVFYGSSSGILGARQQLFGQGIGGLPAGAETGDHFGQTLAAGNFGYGRETDLAIGAPFEDLGAGKADAGAVWVLYGTPAGLSWKNGQILTQNTAGMNAAAEQGDHFGWALSTGHYGRDANEAILARTAATTMFAVESSDSVPFIGPYHDLAIGVPDEDVDTTDEGLVHVLYGSTVGLRLDNTQKIVMKDSVLWPMVNTGARFGAALASGNFGYAHYVDLAIGAPGATNPVAYGKGFFFTWNGSSTGLTREYWWYQLKFPEPPQHCGFGSVFSQR